MVNVNSRPVPRSRGFREYAAWILVLAESIVLLVLLGLVAARDRVHFQEPNGIILWSEIAILAVIAGAAIWITIKLLSRR